MVKGGKLRCCPLWQNKEGNNSNSKQKRGGMGGCLRHRQWVQSTIQSRTIWWEQEGCTYIHEEKLFFKKSMNNFIMKYKVHRSSALYNHLKFKTPSDTGNFYSCKHLNGFLIKFYVAKLQRTSKSIHTQRIYGRQS